MRYLITFSYDGTNYSGYQKQAGLRTIQDEIEKVLRSINNDERVNFTSSGRTDKGVHAKCQKGHCDINVSITEYKLMRAMNSKLPSDIHVIKAEKVASDFHARYMVKAKEYKYYLNSGEYNPCMRNYIYQFGKKLDINKMQEAIKYFVGTHDFKSFTPSRDVKENCTRTIFKANVATENDIIIFTFEGTGFLKYQIRNMVGYLIKVGLGKKSSNDLPKIIALKDRKMASITAHPEGLYLTNVIY